MLALLWLSGVWELLGAFQSCMSWIWGMVQVSCNQRYESKGTAAFQACAVTEQNCVAKKYDEDLYPAPPKSVLVSDFDTTKYKVRFWMLSGN